MTINFKKEFGVTDMKKYEDIVKDIEMIIEEQIELEFVELLGDGTPQFQVKMVNGEGLDEDTILLIDLKRTFSYMSATRTYINIDTSDYIGLLEVYYCKKKKGLFGKESLKTINSVRKTYHRTAMEVGEEKKTSLKNLMKGK